MSRDEYILQRMIEQLRGRETLAREPTRITVPLIDWIAIHGQLQLALRHPEADELAESSKAAKRLIDIIERKALEAGLFDEEILEFLRRNQKEEASKSRRLQ